MCHYRGFDKGVDHGIYDGIESDMVVNYTAGFTFYFLMGFNRHRTNEMTMGFV